MRTWIKAFSAAIALAIAVPLLAQKPPQQGGMAMKKFKVDAFVEKVDANKDGSMAKDEWKSAGLAEMSFTMCDSNKDSILTKDEFAACSLPEAMDSNKDGILAVAEMIEFGKKMTSAPKVKYEATSPYVEGGATGADFIKLFDIDKDGKVTHDEWEKTKNSTVYKDKHWPEYNKNGDEFITVDEAPLRPLTLAK